MSIAGDPHVSEATIRNVVYDDFICKSNWYRHMHKNNGCYMQNDYWTSWNTQKRKTWQATNKCTGEMRAGYVQKQLQRPRVDIVCNGKSYVFQHESAPVHKAVMTQDWAATDLHNDITINIWPPNSQGGNLIDYHMWCFVGRNINQRSHDTKSVQTMCCEYSGHVLKPSLQPKVVISDKYVTQPLLHQCTKYCLKTFRCGCFSYGFQYVLSYLTNSVYIYIRLENNAISIDFEFKDLLNWHFKRSHV